MSVSVQSNSDGSGALLNGANTVLGWDVNGVPTSGNVLGVGQTWVDVTASRVAGVTYTNTTGKPITITIYLLTESGQPVQISSDGITWITSGYSSSGAGVTITVIVPNGWKYRKQAGLNPAYWSELR